MSDATTTTVVLEDVVAALRGVKLLLEYAGDAAQPLTPAAHVSKVAGILEAIGEQLETFPEDLEITIPFGHRPGFSSTKCRVC